MNTTPTEALRWQLLFQDVITGEIDVGSSSDYADALRAEAQATMNRNFALEAYLRDRATGTTEKIPHLSV